MSQQVHGSHALASGEVVPVKRKRGRPRKDTAQAESTPAGHAPDSSKKSKQSGGSGDEANGMLGQVVTGVIDGTFDAGYLLKVKVGDTDTQLRGVVFLPGRFVPITAENDVAPLAKMYKRRTIPFPNIKRQFQPSGSVHPEQSDKQPVEPKDQVSNALTTYSQLSNLQSGIPGAPEHQSSAVVIPPADNVPKTDLGLSLSGKVLPPQMEEPKVDEPGEVLQETAKLMKGPNELQVNEESKTKPESEPVVDISVGDEASKLMKGPHEVEVNEESKAESESEPAADVYPGVEASTLVKGPTDLAASKETKEQPAPPPVVEISQRVAVDKEPEIHGQALSSDPRTDLINDEVKTLNFELNQAPVVFEPKFDINKLAEKVDIGEGDLQEKQPEHAVEIPNGEGKHVGDATEIAGAVSLSAVKHTQEEMMSEGGAVPAESRLASEGHVPAGPTEPEIHSPSGDIISMECDENNAIPPPSQS